MSNLLKTATLLLCFAFTQNLHAQTITAADQKGVDACYNAFVTAFDNMDASGLGPWFTENAEEINPLGELVRGRANLVTNYTNLFAYFKSQPKPDKVERNNTNQQSRYLASDLILFTYISEETLHFGDKKESNKMATSVLLRKKDNKWMVELLNVVPVTPMPGAPSNK